MEKHKSQNECNHPPATHVIDSKLALYWEKGGIWLACTLVAICAWLFVKQEAKVEQLEVKVQALQVDKVSRQELKDMEDRIYNRMDSMKGDIIFHINMLREKK